MLKRILASLRRRNFVTHNQRIAECRIEHNHSLKHLTAGYIQQVRCSAEMPSLDNSIFPTRLTLGSRSL
jgi:hypothetical protein